jgi:hypothetical protein
MPPKPVRQEILERAQRTLEAHDHSRAAAAAELGVPVTTLKNWISKGWVDSPDPRPMRGNDNAPKKVHFPELPAPGLPIEDVIDQMCRRFERTIAHETAKKDYKITMSEGGAFGVLCFGDPHLGSNGCNWPLLRKHIEIAKQPHVYGWQCGDVGDNWPEKLARLWAEQDASSETEWQLIDWFLSKAGITWLPHLLGNHDRWNNGGRLIKLMAGDVPVFDWKGTFIIQNKSGQGFKMLAAHGLKGRSDWSEMHELARASRTGEEADVFISGHTHTFGIWDREIAERNYSAKLIKVRGYKFIDKYALHNGFAVHQRGAAVMIVFDPAQTEKAEQLTVFADPAKGLEYLQMVRAR